MREYITKEQALRRFSYFGREIPKDMVFEVIASLQEEIVRCKDCKHYKPFDKSKKFDCPQGLYAVFENDYCSYGERSEE